MQCRQPSPVCHHALLSNQTTQRFFGGAEGYDSHDWCNSGFWNGVISFESAEMYGVNRSNHLYKSITFPGTPGFSDYVALSQGSLPYHVHVYGLPKIQKMGCH